MNIIITPEVIEYINKHNIFFELKTPSLGEIWKVNKVKTYPNINNNEPVVEVSNGNQWMRLPKNIVKFKLNIEFEDIEYLLNEIKCMSGCWVKTNPDCEKILEKFNKKIFG